jgi:hypothetical protein
MYPSHVNSKQFPWTMWLSWQNSLHPLPNLTLTIYPNSMSSLQLTTWFNGPDSRMLEKSQRHRKSEKFTGRTWNQKKYKINRVIIGKFFFFLSNVVYKQQTNLEDVALDKFMIIRNERYSPALVLRLWKGGKECLSELSGLSRITNWNESSPKKKKVSLIIPVHE